MTDKHSENNLPSDKNIAPLVNPCNTPIESEFKEIQTIINTISDKHLPEIDFPCIGLNPPKIILNSDIEDNISIHSNKDASSVIQTHENGKLSNGVDKDKHTNGKASSISDKIQILNVVSEEIEEVSSKRKRMNSDSHKAEEKTKLEKQINQETTETTSKKKRKIPVSRTLPIDQSINTSKSSLLNSISLTPKRGRPYRESTKTISFNASIYQSFNKIPGKVYVMGQGDAGQLGLGTDKAEVEIPELVDIKKAEFTQIVCGGMHTLLLSQAGVVYSAGCNDEGVLGRITKNDDEYTFKPIDFPHGEIIHKVTCGDSHSVALTADGAVFAWGTFRDNRGPVGLISNEKWESSPKCIYKNKDYAVDICSGSNHLIILTCSGRVLTCGCGDEGQLGRIQERSIASRGGRRGFNHLTLPQETFIVNQASRRVKLDPVSFRVVRIAASKYTSYAFLKNGDLYGWGLNNYHQLGSNYPIRAYFPVNVRELVQTCSESKSALDLHISGGFQHILVLNTTTNVLYSFGDPAYGRLGRDSLDYPYDEDREEELDPTEYIKPVKLPNPDLKFETTACGDACSFAITTTKKLYSWGMGTNLQLGFNSEEDILVPTLVSSQSTSNNKIIQVSSGSQHTAILCSL